MNILFWISIIFLFYTYFGYPLLMAFLLMLKKEKPINKADITPQISIVVSAYNEEKNIGAKLNNLTNLDYPKDKIEIVVISDKSSDRTDEIVKGFSDEGVKLVKLHERSGKIAAYRKVLPQLKGEIIVFSDATSIIYPATISKLMRNFNDKSVGCAGGLLIYVNSKDAIVGKGEKKYWSYEKRIRDFEWRISSLPSVSGTLYAIRKELYPLDMKDYLADDLIAPFNVVKKGFRTVFEKEAVCRDYTTLDIKEEMAKRIRITVQNIRGLLEYPGILNPFKYGLFSLLVISHKLFRLLVPVFLLILFVVSVILSFYAWFFVPVTLVQIVFYALGLSGYSINKKVKFGLGNSLFYFCLSNLAILEGIIEFLKGYKVVTWETVRE